MAGVRTATTKAVTYAPQVEKIPLLPGNNFHDDPFNRSTLRKSHGLGKAPTQQDYVPPTEYSHAAHPLGYDPPLRKVKETSDDIQRRWASFDDPYTFMGYFKEPVAESATESYRLRKVAITYYKNDKTLQIREAKTHNSGMMTSVHGGGPLLVRRHVVYDVDATPLDLEDLQIGEEFECYGKVFRILACLGKTREKLQAEGWSVPSDQPFPHEEDLHAKANAIRMQMKGVRQLHSDDMDVKRQAEFAVVGRYSKLHPDAVRGTIQFLGAEGSRHLTYNAYWDDRDTPRGDLHMVVIKYYPEDDTFEVCEKKQVNSGRDGGSKLMCRQRLAKDRQAVRPQHNTFGHKIQYGYLTAGDIKIGETYSIHEKDFFVYDADQFTREWYKKQLGVALPAPVDVEGVLKKHAGGGPVRHYPPAHDGWGTDEDSLGSWKRLMLKPLQKDVGKLLREGHKVLRYRAVLETQQHPSDAERNFVLNYYIATGEYEIIESHARNSGIISGKFLGKTVLHRTDEETGEKVRLSEADLGVGRVVHILGRDFRLMEIDTRSQKFIDGVENDPEPAEVKALVVLLKDLLNQHHETLAGAVRAKTIISLFDSSGVGYIEFNDFVRMMEYESSQNLDAAANRAAAITLHEVLPAHDTLHDVQSRALAQRQLYERTIRLLRDRLLQRRMKQQEIYRVM
eukprot:gene20220-31089_t